MVHLLRALVLAGLVAGCASPGGFQYAREVGSNVPVKTADGRGEITVIWRFGSPEWVSMMCRNGSEKLEVHGCAMRDPASERCVMFLVEPKDFQDRDRLAVIGHELWHCLGARHL